MVSSQADQGLVEAENATSLAVKLTVELRRCSRRRGGAKAGEVFVKVRLRVKDRWLDLCRRGSVSRWSHASNMQCGEASQL